MPRAWDPEHPELQIDPDAPAEGVVITPPRAPAPNPPIVEEKWAFESRTVQGLIVSGAMWWLSTTPAVAFFDRALVADAVKMIFELVGTAGLGVAFHGRNRHAGGVTPHLYWLPRRREA